MPHREELIIEVRASNVVSGMPELSVSRERGEERILIHHQSKAIRSIEERQQLRDRIMELIAEILPRMAVGNDFAMHIEKLAREEGVFTRSLAFSEIDVCVENILGAAPKLQLADWIAQEKDFEEFPMLREKPWDLADNKEKMEVGISIWAKAGTGTPPAELRRRNLKHSAIRVASLIDLPLWDMARWHAALFAFSPEPFAMPYLAFGFRDAEAARQIFEGLRAKLSDVDKEEQLRISIITGIDRLHPLDYTVGVTKNLSTDEVDEKTEYVMVARFCRMHPQDGRNLNGFLERFHRTKSYRVAPAYFDGRSSPQAFYELGILKTELVVRPAWQIGDNDPDMMGLDIDVQPVIPEDVRDAPVIRAFERLKKIREKR
jgi:hypothetical protein